MPVKKEGLHDMSIGYGTSSIFIYIKYYGRVELSTKASKGRVTKPLLSTHTQMSQP